MVTSAELYSSLSGLGLRKGDVVHLHSAMRALGPVENGFEGFTGVFQDIIGEDGIFSVPTHTWLNVGRHQPVFHQKSTPSNLGAYSNYVLSRSDFKRSLHPSHSMAVWGRRTDEFLTTSLNTPCPPDGCYARLKEWKGKVVHLGVNLTRCTYLHCLEEIAGLGEIWSLQQNSYTKVVFSNTNEMQLVEYRSHENCKNENYYRIENDLINMGILLQGFVGPAPVKILDAEKAADYLLPIFAENPRFFW